MMPTEEQVIEESEELVELIKPILAGVHPGIQGCAISDLAAIWLAGHPKDLEAELIEVHLAYVRRLVKFYRQRKAEPDA